MKPSIVAMTLIATVSVLAAGCGGGTEQNSGSPAPAGVSTPGQSVDVTLTSEPSPPRTGENTFEVMVMSGGQPVTDADVSVEFFMAAMPAMKMPEMRNSVVLKHEGGGRYRGTGNVMMAGNWDATVSVKRGGQEIGSQKVPITAN
jgi:Cu(I)/Ag(I) efflux system membrane fusion protein/cobalt-zinc-cadmium efflux system membrane fusion protein